MADAQTLTPNSDTDKAKADALAAQTKAIEAQNKANDATKTKEQLSADKAKADADDANAKLVQVTAEETVPAGVSTVKEAKIMAPVPNDMMADEHMAQKFGNDPANPQPLPGTTDGDGKIVELYRITPDSPDRVTIKVYPDNVGNYLRAGWSRD